MISEWIIVLNVLNLLSGAFLWKCNCVVDFSVCEGFLWVMHWIYLMWYVQHWKVNWILNLFCDILFLLKHVTFKFQNQSIVLDGAEGVMVSADKLPFAAETQDSAPRWYKLCVCMPSGRVFRIPVRDHGYGCQDVRFPESINPCS